MAEKLDAGRFSRVLDELLDPESLLSPLFLVHLSSLSSENAASLARAWEDIPTDRRRSLVTDLESFAEADPLLFFDAVGRIASSDPDPQVRQSAIRLTALDEDPAFAEELIRMLEEDEHFEVRAEAASALGKYVYLGEIEEIPEEVKRRVEDALMQARGRDPQVLVCRRALEAVSFSNRPEITGLIEDAYGSDDEDWQISAIFAMGASANPAWQRQVAEALSTDSALLRSEAARAAGKLSLETLKPALFEAAHQDPIEDVRVAATWALSDIGGPDVFSFLEERAAEAGEGEMADFYAQAIDNCLEAQLFNDFDLPLFDFDEDSLNGLNEIDPDE